MIKKLSILIVLGVAFTGLSTACSLLEESEASKYTSDSEDIGELFEVDVDDSRYCVFEIKNPELESKTIVIGKESSERVTDEKILFKVLKNYKTTKYVQSKSEMIESGLDEAYNDMREIERVENSFGDIISNIDKVSGTVEVCVSAPGYDFFEVCSGDELTELTARRTCMDISSFLSCADWEKSIENFNNLRGLNQQLEDTDTVYEGEVKTYYERGIAIDHFLKTVDEEANTSISDHLDTKFEEMFKENSEWANSEIILIENRVGSRQDSLDSEIDEKERDIQDLKREIKEKRADGFIVEENRKSVCKASKVLPDESALEKENFDIVEQDLQSVERTISKIDEDYEKAGLMSKPVIWFDGVVWSLTGVC